MKWIKRSHKKMKCVSEHKSCSAEDNPDSESVETPTTSVY